jgi:hypothetical protein
LSGFNIDDIFTPMDFETQLRREMAHLDEREEPKVDPTDALNLLKQEAAFNTLAREVLKKN